MRLTATVLVIAGMATATSCKSGPSEDATGSTLARATTGHFAERRQDGQLLRVAGGWALGTGPLDEAARLFVEDHREALELPDGVQLGEPNDLGQVVAIQLSYEGYPVFGGDVRVHVIGAGADRRVMTVTMLGPTGFGETTASLAKGAAEQTAVSLGSGETLDGDPELRWLAMGLLRGEPAAARLAWHVPTRNDATGAESVVWVDANDGRVLWQEARSVRLREVWSLRDVTGEPDKIMYRDGQLVEGRTPDPEAVAANEHTEAACDRLQQTFGEARPCDQLRVVVDTGVDSNAASASCVWEGRRCATNLLEFGAQTPLLETALGTFHHEMWHGLVQQAAPLAHALEPGSVNEAYADLNHFSALRPSEWVVAGGGTTRNISDPNASGHPSHRNQLRVTARATDALDSDNDYGFVHLNSVILSHGMWKAVVEGGFVDLENSWRPIGYDKGEQLLYMATTKGSGEVASLRNAADDLIFACLRSVLDDLYAGDKGTPPHGLRESDCGSLVNAMAAVGLSDGDRDIDGLPDGMDPCPDFANIRHLIEYESESDCEAPPAQDIKSLCPETLEALRGPVTFVEYRECDFQPANKASEHGHQCQACVYEGASAQAFLQISTTSVGGSRLCQPLGEIEPGSVLTLADRGQYAAVQFGFFGEFAEIPEMLSVIDQLEPALSEFAIDCTGAALGLEPAITTAPLPTVADNARGAVVVRYSGTPIYPVTVTAPAPGGACDAQFDCAPEEAVFNEDDTTAQGTARQFDWNDAVRCVAPTEGPSPGTLSIQLTDAGGTRSNVSMLTDRCGAGVVP